ncbi:Regulator of chromosome condensation 1/beta-lactamase-inhibitor protein II [Cynara cardunculus var. scolymus]|uniref:Regulator of chromosome condensation 1/beta-lactamase-inhibitor protein II n=1 Tax=Cynara cardunculus var. scolymus TaxID=59895 RepID=A0A103YJZ8_CYNCS|nr:Regulator of chromosome condensation 1/beta-lactamase-inhibitor protein II [Cynara cardunculus var. scolymus]
MGDRFRSATQLDDLPLHLIFEILTSGGLLGVMDLVCLELTNSTFRGTHGLVPHKLKSLVCGSHPIYVCLSYRAQEELLTRCAGNWKRILRYHTLLIKDSTVYSCGSSLCGVLGHGPETTQCVAFTPIKFPNHAHVTHVSASHNHAAFVTQSGEVFTCGDNSSFCCGHSDTSRPIFKPRLVEALKEVRCKQVAAGVSFTVFLTREGQVYTCGTSAHGQLGHGDTLDRPTPKLVEALVSVGPVVQIAAGPGYALAVTNDGTVYSFGSGTNFCLGHGEQHNELRPRPLQSFRRKGIHIVRVSAGDEHVVALDSNGYVYTWGKGYCGALGHGDEIDKTTPKLLSSLKTHLAVQDHHISQVSTGLYHSVVVTSRGRIFGFGDNERAQLSHDKLRACREPSEILVQEAAGGTLPP